MIVLLFILAGAFSSYVCWTFEWCCSSIYKGHKSLLNAKWRIKAIYNPLLGRSDYYVQARVFLFWYYLEPWDELNTSNIMGTAGAFSSEAAARQRIEQVKEKLNKVYSSDKNTHYIEVD